VKCFKKDYVKPTEIKPIDGELVKRKTGLGIGHSKADKGANNKDWYVKAVNYDPVYDEYVKEYDLDGDRILEEYELNLKAAKISTLTYADRNEGRGRRGMAEELAERDCTEAIAMHCNQYNGKVPGYEFWYLDGVIESKRFTQNLHDRFKEAFPEATSRGIKRAKKGSRPYGVLDAFRDHGIRSCSLAEWYFLDVKSDFIPPEEIGRFLRKFGQR